MKFIDFLWVYVISVVCTIYIYTCIHKLTRPWVLCSGFVTGDMLMKMLRAKKKKAAEKQAKQDEKDHNHIPLTDEEKESKRIMTEASHKRMREKVRAAPPPHPPPRLSLLTTG